MKDYEAFQKQGLSEKIILLILPIPTPLSSGKGAGGEFSI